MDVDASAVETQTGQFGNQQLTRVISALLIGWLIFLGACSEPQFLGQPSGEKGQQAINMSGLTMDVSQHGQLQYKIEAERAFLVDDDNTLNAEKIKITFFATDKDKPIAELKADKGTLFLAPDNARPANKNDILLEGNVIYKTVDDITFETEALRWDDKSQTLKSDTPFVKRYVMPDGIVEIRGTGFETDKTLTNWIDKGAIKIYSKGN